MKKFIIVFISVLAVVVLFSFLIANAAPVTPIYGGGTQTSTLPGIGSAVGSNGVTFCYLPSSTSGYVLAQSSTAPCGIAWVAQTGGGGSGVASTTPFTVSQIVTVSSSGALATNGFKTSDFAPSTTISATTTIPVYSFLTSNFAPSSTISASTTIIVPNGQTNFIPLWTGTSALGTSTMSISGTTIMQNGNLQINKLLTVATPVFTQAAAGTFVTGVQYWAEVTAVDGNGIETTVSPEVTTTTATSSASLTLTIAHIPSAAFYKYYLATSTNGEVAFATTTINTLTFTTSTLNAAGGPRGTSTPPTTNSTVAWQIASSTSFIGPIFGKCGLLINTTTLCNNQNTQEDLTLANGTVSIGGGTLTFRAMGGGAPTLTSGSDLNISNSSGQKIALTSGGTMTFSTAATTAGIYTFGLVTTTTNSMNMNGQANFNVLNVSSTATLGSTTINGQATTTNLSVTAVTSSPLAVNSSGLLERMTITTTTESISKLIDSTTTVTVVNNTAASTTFYTFTLPGGTLDNTGKMLRIAAAGTFTYAGPANTNLSLWLLYGGQACIQKATGAITTSTGQGSWFANFHLGNASGSTSFQECDIFSAEAGGSAANIVSASSTAVDSTSAQSLVLKIQMNNANASNTIIANLVNVMLDGATSTVVTGFSFN